jgi:ribonucleoside-diphosphate reductase beta chain
MQFAKDVLSGGVMGLSEKDMLEYLRYVADGHFARLGMDPVYNAKCPFEFMLKQDIIELTSFFERTNASYATGVGGEVLLDEEF